ncbi:hypothetical protein JYU34_018544 [Plutella xylostella]|uniref:Uncharacterized protein n=1 Tax=Plutella xylostella TaxID=51655 RepID=A0ABQ7PXU1_PLUXY|nr:hypothetical protein JYU34_018544 [Plutella xylostella]
MRKIRRTQLPIAIDIDGSEYGYPRGALANLTRGAISARSFAAAGAVSTIPIIPPIADAGLPPETYTDNERHCKYAMREATK